MAQREDPGFAKAIGADPVEVSNLNEPMANLDQPMTLASVLEKPKSGKFFHILS